jgi:hypothetical protein
MEMGGSGVGFGGTAVGHFRRDAVFGDEGSPFAGWQWQAGGGHGFASFDLGGDVLIEHEKLCEQVAFGGEAIGGEHGSI